MGAPIRAAAAANLAQSEKVLDGPLGIVNGEVVKTLHRHANVEESFYEVADFNKPDQHSAANQSPRPAGLKVPS